MNDQDHKYLVLKKFKGVNTQPSREALAQDEFAWLENMQPIGDAFLQAVPATAVPTATITGTISKMHPCTLGTVNYQIAFTTAGGAQAINLGTGNVVQICASGTFSGTPSMDQWKSERIVIADNNGMTSWDGTLFYPQGSIATISVTVTGSGFTSTPTVSISGGGGVNATAVCTLSGGGIGVVTLSATGTGFTSAPSVTFTGGGGTGATASAFIMPTGMNGAAIAVYSGRVWVANSRLISYTAPNTWYDTATADAAGSTTVTEGSLRQQIYAMYALNNYLYIFGDSSIIAIGDLKVSGSVTTFSETFLSSTTGTTLPDTVTAMERAIIFVNKYGVYALFGASVTKISRALDGIFPKIDFTQEVSSGLVTVNNILCYAFSFTYQDTSKNRELQALYFDNKWFFTSQGDGVLVVAPSSISGMYSLWCSSGTDITKMYGNSNGAISTTIKTGLYDLGNPIFNKMTVRAGLEYTAPASSSVTFNVDTEIDTIASTSTTSTAVSWTNSSANTVTWLNSSANTVSWITSQFTLDDFNVAITGKYLGATVTSSAPQLILNGILMEYKQGAAW